MSWILSRIRYVDTAAEQPGGEGVTEHVRVDMTVEREAGRAFDQVGDGVGRALALAVSAVAGDQVRASEAESLERCEQAIRHRHRARLAAFRQRPLAVPHRGVDVDGVGPEVEVLLN